MSNVSIVDEFRRIADWYPQKDAFVQADGEQRYTYKEANDLACQFAHQLLANGVKKGDRVAFLSQTTVEHAITYFGCLKIGAVPAPLHHREASNVVLDMIEDVRPKVLVYQTHLLEDIDKDAVVDEVNELIAVGDPNIPEAVALSTYISGGRTTEPDIEINKEETAFICFSSGTTGTPKGIVHTHSDTVSCAYLGQYILNVRNNDTLLNAFTPSFIGWENMVFPFVMAGATTVVLENWRPNKIIEIIDREEVSTALFVPTQWKEILNQDNLNESDLDSFRIAAYAGERMGSSLLSQLQDNLADSIVGDYGTTETHFSGAALFPSQSDLDSIGRPVPQCDIRVVDPQKNDPESEVPRGEVGELIVSGPSVASEVWENPDKTREIFRDGWFFSGDLARVKDTGDIQLKGRTDNMIISGGINIYAEKVETVLETHPQIAECAVVGVLDEKLGEAVKAYVVSAGGIDEDQIDQWCKNHNSLSDYQRPRQYEFVNELPRTNTGKLNRAALRSE
jgi:acyl-coenzyme A synthetase/AMP-(fatty) acid ligase